MSVYSTSLLLPLASALPATRRDQRPVAPSRREHTTDHTTGFKFSFFRLSHVQIYFLRFNYYS